MVERSPRLESALADLQAELFQQPASGFGLHAHLRAEAMLLRDAKADRITAADWERIGSMLVESWQAAR